MKNTPGSAAKLPAIDFALAERDDLQFLAETFARDGVISIPDVLTQDCAAALYNMLRARQDWKQVINSGEKLVELDRETRASLGDERTRQLDEAVYAGARNGFQFRYETLRVPDSEQERMASDDPLAAFASWWSGGAARDLLREVTGMAGIDFADAQATAYSPGDFLTQHTDDVAGKNRLGAYVLGLNPKWRLEWGGLLVFHSGNPDENRALVPGFNRLNIFRVPQPHSVSEVTRAAAYRRYSITGWLRHGAP